MEALIIPLTQKDGYVTNLFYYKSSISRVHGNVLILHGMAEHLGRYQDFIQSLTQEGFDVYIYNHRGHGTDKELTDLGYVADKNGANILVQDAYNACLYIKGNARCNQLAVFGHSMGSLILRCLMQTYDEMDCAIVSSSTMPPAAVSKAGAFLADLLSFLQGPKKRSQFLQNAMFGGKAYTSLCSRTSYDWLTRNNDIIDNYMNDPYCGFLCTTSFYGDLAKLSARAASKNSIAKTRKDLPVLFLAGGKDPVGGCSIQILRLHQLYTKLGFTKTEITLYPEDRHELLNELNAAEVYQDIFTWLHANLQ